MAFALCIFASYLTIKQLENMKKRKVRVRIFFHSLHEWVSQNGLTQVFFEKNKCLDPQSFHFLLKNYQGGLNSCRL